MKIYVTGLLAACLLATVLAAQPQAAPASSAADERAHATSLMDEGTRLLGQRTPEALQSAVVTYQQASSLWQKLGDSTKQVEALLGEATAQFYLHRNDEARALVTQAGEVARTAGNRRDEATVLNSSATLYDSLGDEQKALDETARSRTIYQSLGDKDGEAQDLLMQGTVYGKLKDTSNALASYEQSLPLFRASNNRLGEALALFYLAQLSNALSQPGARQKAIDYYTQALPLFQASNSRRAEALTLLALGQLNLEPGGFEKAIDYFTQAVPLFHAASDGFNEGDSWWGIGTANDRLGHKQQARDAYLNALPFFVEEKHDLEAGRTLLDLAQDEDALGNLPKAVEYYEQALPLLASQGDGPNQWIALARLGKARQKLGDPARAIHAYKAAIAVGHSTGDKADEATAYLMLGTMLFEQHDWKGALDADAISLKLSEETGYRSTQAEALGGMASINYTLGDYKKALGLSLRQISLLEGDPVPARKAAALVMAGNSYSALHDNKNALESLHQSLLLQETPNGKAGVLASMGEVYSGIGDQKKALELEQQALEILPPLNDPALTNKVSNDLGLTYSAMGKKSQALKLFEASLASARARNDLQQQSASLNNLAGTYQDFGDTKQAEALYGESLVLIHQVGDRDAEAGTLSNLGMVYHRLGEEQKAEDTLNQAARIRRELADRHGEAIALNNLALFYGDTGELQKALESYEQVQSVFKELGDPPEVGTTLNNLGSLYHHLGMNDRAQLYYQQALEIRKQTDDDEGRMVTLNNLAVLALSTNDPANNDNLKNAREYYLQALQLAEKLGNRVGQASLLSGLGVIDSDLGNQTQAIEQLQRSLEISRQTGNLYSQAVALQNLGRVYEDRSDPSRALDLFHQALALWQQINSVEGEAITLYTIARVERKQGDPKAALGHVDDSIRRGESLRSRLGSEELRASLLSTKGNSYELKIAILMQLNQQHKGEGYDARAFETSEGARARSLVDLLTESRANIRQGVDPQLLVQEQTIRQSLNAKALQLRKLTESGPQSPDLEPLKREMEDLSAAYEGVEGQIRSKSPAYAALTQPKPLTVQEIQRELDSDTLLLEYSLGKEHSYLWAVTPTSLFSYELPERETIEGAAYEFHKRLSETANPAGLKQAAKELSNLLLGPVASELKKKQLIVVSDGLVQQYVPFSALPVPSGPNAKAPETPSPLLVADHEIIAEPSASAIAALRREVSGRKRPPKTVAVLADPVFDPNDERLVALLARSSSATAAQAKPRVLPADAESATQGTSLERLQKSSEEANNILGLTTPAQSLAKLGFDASKANAESPELADYQMVHFATHGVLDQDHPELSGVVFSLYDQNGQSVDGFLRLNEIFNLKLPVELVVLSACQSGQGKLIGGEGLVGLTRGFMYAGAASMVVSLWKVDDAATAELMTRFYQKMLGSEHLRPPAALRAAQLSMINDTKINDTKWKQPWYWAAFIVEGEWR
jgi:CHAT domain-containing protein